MAIRAFSSRWLSVVAAATILGLLAACSGGEGDDRQTAGAGSQRVASVPVVVPTAVTTSSATVAAILPTPAPTVASAPAPTPAPTTPPDPVTVVEPAPTATGEVEEPAPPVLPATIVDVQGNVVVVEDVSRIVVLNGDFTEVVFALGLGEHVVAVDSSATYPDEVQELPQIGYQRSLSAEGILSMNPTLVIGNLNAGPPEVLEQVRSTGVPVVILDNVSTIDGAAQKIRNISVALGVPDRGEELATDLETQIEEVRALVAHVEEKPTAVFLYMRGLDSLFLIGRDHLSHELFEATGAISGGAAAGVMRPFVPLTAEALAAANPDCIVVLTAGLMSVGGRDGLLTIPGVAQTKAAQEGCIVDFDDQYFGGGGPRMGQVLMDLLRVFHPDLAPAQ